MSRAITTIQAHDARSASRSVSTTARCCHSIVASRRVGGRADAPAAGVAWYRSDPGRWGMATPTWQLSGRYYETCSCDFVCPCILGQMVVAPTKGWCTFAMGLQIERGVFDDVSLDGLGFIVLGHTPEAMAKGNWSVGLVVDERATPAQRDAIAAIASGSAGGPMAVLSGLVGKFLGVEAARIQFEPAGMKWSVSATPFLDMSAQAAMGVN